MHCDGVRDILFDCSHLPVLLEQSCVLLKFNYILIFKSNTRGVVATSQCLVFPVLE